MKTDVRSEEIGARSKKYVFGYRNDFFPSLLTPNASPLTLL